jgi:clan AA aspartic protease
MIVGLVNDRIEAVLSLRLTGPAGTAEVSAIIDTGFTGSLTVPKTIATSLGLPCTSRGHAILADGSDQEFDVYAAEIEWGQSSRKVLVSALGNEVLLGMSLLTGHELRMEIRPKGAVEVRPLPN